MQGCKQSSWVLFCPVYKHTGAPCAPRGVIVPADVRLTQNPVSVCIQTFFFLRKNLLNHLKMMWQVLKRSPLAPSTKAKKHQAPFRAARLCYVGEAAGASKSLRARGEQLSSIGAFCPRSAAFYCAGPALIIIIMCPRCIAYIKANGINLYTSGVWAERLLSNFLKDNTLYSTHRLNEICALWYSRNERLVTFPFSTKITASNMHRNSTSKVLLPDLHVLLWALDMELALFLHQMMKKHMQNGVFRSHMMQTFIYNPKGHY